MRILLADDDATVLTMLGGRLRKLGHEIDLARNGVEALELAKTSPPDAVVLDVMMPELNGYQACRRIKAEPHLADIPVVLLTGRDTEADRFWGAEVGAALFLGKPVDAEELLQRIDALLGT